MLPGLPFFRITLQAGKNYTGIPEPFPQVIENHSQKLAPGVPCCRVARNHAMGSIMTIKSAVALVVISFPLLFAVACGTVPDSVNAATAPPAGGSNPPFSDAKKGVLSPPSLALDEVTVPAGTPISVRLQNAISSASNRPGDEFASVMLYELVVVGK